MKIFLHSGLHSLNYICIVLIYDAYIGSDLLKSIMGPLYLMIFVILLLMNDTKVCTFVASILYLKSTKALALAVPAIILAWGSSVCGGGERGTRQR